MKCYLSESFTIILLCNDEDKIVISLKIYYVSQSKHILLTAAIGGIMGKVKG